ncbi:hypothetical protein [Crossiella cryophila]|uniref:YtxH domain-containing protein n=1 Tax=Crossiella cryophila TaxID=43355 RepID=A0A7W7FSQ8_9PSEU|nr:hypothetical protein [Crossiella cryophila]MBB4676447.1 hypothetical protein [Crossiella cryophila]
MIRFALGVAVGYVLGTRAGRERYDGLVRMYHRLVGHPAVQGAAGAGRAKIDEWLGRRSPRDVVTGLGETVVSEVDRQRVRAESPPAATPAATAP